MVNPRYRPFNGNSRNPVKQKAEKKLSAGYTVILKEVKEFYQVKHLK